MKGMDAANQIHGEAMSKKCSKCDGIIDLINDGFSCIGDKYLHSPECPPASAQVIEFPKIHVCDNAVAALEMAKGWNFSHVMIVGYVDGYGTPEGTVISSATGGIKTAKELLFMAELLRYQALKMTGLE